MNMNCLFVDTGRERILIETGIGDKWSPRQASMYAIARRQSLAETLLEKTGCSAEEITVVVNTHLHFDHAGGNTKLSSSGEPVPTFPNARYLVSRKEFEHAEAPTERDRASYMTENWRPLVDSGQLELKESRYEVVPGLIMETVPGHSRTMQCARLDRGGKTLFSFADLVPTRAHVPLPWIMGYDLYPVETLEAKRRLLPQAARENWLCFFYHDPDQPFGRLVEQDGKVHVSDFEDDSAAFIPGE
jgi:glyoxylase-like metal-dependent hydrolase (beta-lactamase superfamily II)